MPARRRRCPRLSTGIAPHQARGRCQLGPHEGCGAALAFVL
jgi:hypothetical protein